PRAVRYLPSRYPRPARSCAAPRHVGVASPALPCSARARHARPPRLTASCDSAISSTVEALMATGVYAALRHSRDRQVDEVAEFIARPSDRAPDVAAQRVRHELIALPSAAPRS